MANISNDTDRQAAGVALFGPPHRRINHYFRVKKEGRLETCDQLYAQMEIDSDRLKYLDKFSEPPTSIFGQIVMLPYLPIFMNLDGVLDELRAEETATLRRYMATSRQYDRECLGKKEVLEKGLLRQAADVAVRGAQFVYDHPGIVAAAVGVGAVLVFAPEFAPVVLAF